MANRETGIQNLILAGLSHEYHPHGTFMRINSGLARQLHGDRPIRMAPKGTADIVGCLFGCYIELEVKTDDGTQRESQSNRQRAVEKAGGIYLLVRSLDDALAQLTAALQARGLLDPGPGPHGPRLP